MGRWSLAALGVAAVAVVGLLLWELQRGPRAGSGSGRIGSAEPERGTAAVAPGGEGELFEPPPARRLRHVPTIEEVGDERMQLLLSGDVPQRLLRAAAGCYRGEPGRAERMKVAYTLHFEQGRATIEDVEVVSSEIGAPRLEQCVAATLGALSWTDRDAPNLLRDMELEISILDLRSRQAPDPGADDAPNDNDRDG